MKVKPESNEPAATSGFRADLLGFRPLHRLLKLRAFQPLLQAPFVVVFLFLVYAGLFEYPSAGGLTVVVTWVIWWAGIVFLVALFGKLWCTVCPWNAIADWVNRLSLFRRVEKQDLLSPSRPWPRSLRNISMATTLFVALVWLELLPGLDMVINARATAVLALLILLLSLVCVLIYDRSSFCRYGCLVGRVSGLYSMFAPMELRARDKAICRECRTKDCFRGNAAGYPCPTFENLSTMDRNTYCILCTECIKSCPRDNVALNLRPFASDLLNLSRTRSDEAYLCVIMLSLTLFHIITMTPLWTLMERSLRASVGLGRIASYTALMLVILVVPGLIQFAASWSAWRLAGKGERSLKQVFVHFAYPLLPLALFGHMAHNSDHLLEEGAYIVPALTDPLNRAWDVLGLGEAFVARPLAGQGAIDAIKLSLLALGFVFSVLCAVKAARLLFRTGRQFRLALAPELLSVVFFASFQVWILAKPMVSRLGVG